MTGLTIDVLLYVAQAQRRNRSDLVVLWVGQEGFPTRSARPLRCPSARDGNFVAFGALPVSVELEEMCGQPLVSGNHNVMSSRTSFRPHTKTLC